ncbi:hypothetical protein [Staphylospora marina]|uniref:hypothetical protein n=1 Tax=Staphylospora marina TaxID=2490858 RepID=UPI000F5C13A7|nr:hypothetical protein [Staphylospora marina]
MTAWDVLRDRVSDGVAELLAEWFRLWLERKHRENRSAEEAYAAHRETLNSLEERVKKELKDHERQPSDAVLTKAEAFVSLKTMEREEWVLEFEQARQTSIQTGRSAEETFHERLKARLIHQVMDRPAGTLVQVNAIVERVEKVKRNLWSMDKDINERLGHLYRMHMEGKIGKEEFVGKRDELLKDRDAVLLRKDKCLGLEKRLQLKLQQELQSISPGVRTERLSLRQTWERIAIIKSGQLIHAVEGKRETPDQERTSDRSRSDQDRSRPDRDAGSKDAISLER